MIKSSIKIGNLNINGMYSNMDKRIELNNYLEINNFDIFTIQEWYIHDNPEYKKFFNNNFKNYKYIAPNDKTLILYKNYLQNVKIETENIKIKGLDITWLVLKIDKESVLIIASFYHSPSFESEIDIIARQINNIQKQLKRFRNIYININDDFNAKNEIWGSTENDTRGTNILELCEENDLVCINNGEHTYINKKTKKTNAIDISLVSENLVEYIRNWKVDKTLTNEWKTNNNYKTPDHYVMKFKINFEIIKEKEPIIKTWKFNDEKNETYKKNIKNKMQKWWKLFNKYKNNKKYINKLVQLFQNMLIIAASESFGMKKYTKSSVPGINKYIINEYKKCKKMKNKIINLKKKLQRNNNKWNKNIIKQKRKEINNLNKLKKNKLNKIKICRKKLMKKNDENMEKLINNPNVDNTKIMHRMYNIAANNNNNKITLIRDKNTKEIIASNKKDIAQHLVIEFNKPLKRNKYNKEAINEHNKIKNFMEKYETNKNNNESTLNRAFTEQEIINRINKLNLASAMAWDMIHFKLISIAKYEIIRELTALLNILYRKHQYIPKQWKYSEYIPAAKPGRDATFTENIRPLQIIPGLMRLINGLICDRFIKDAIDRNLLRMNNIAFQKNKSPEDIYLALTEKVLRAMQNGHFIELAFMDLKSAYDSVWIEALLYKLIKKYKYDGNIIAWLKDYYNNRYNRVKMDDIVSNWTKALENLPQGCPASVILFDIFLDDYEGINMNINNITYNIDMNNFADDCSLEMNTYNYNCNLTNKMKKDWRTALQNEMNNFYQYTLNNKLILKKVKCNTVTFSRKNNFKAYVYNLDKNKLKVVHAIEHAPRICYHNERFCYKNGIQNANLLNDENDISDLENLDENGNKINNNNETNTFNMNDFDIRNIKNNEVKIKAIKRQNKFYNNVSETVRILGVHFDPKLKFDKHIEQTTNRIRKDVYKLIKITKCKYYNLNAHTIWKLWTSAIRPKIEYALCTISSATTFKTLDKIQNKVARIALRLNKMTPSIYTKEILNIKTIKERLEELQVKLWIKYKRAPTNFKQKQTFLRWKNYIENNNGNINYNRNLRNKKINLNENFNINSRNLKYIAKSPLSRAYKLIRSITPANQIVFKKKEDTVLKSPPIYTEKFPNNIKIINGNKWDENQVNKNINNSHITFFTDGSCIPNPGPGASAYYSPNFEIENKTEGINHDTTINYAELNSIKMVLEDILNSIINKENKNEEYKKIIKIFTDSQFVINLMDINGYPKFNYYYKLMETIINITNRLKNYGIKIIIIKIRSHKNIIGNEKADKLAKKEANIVKTMAKNSSEWYKRELNSINVDIAYLLMKLKKKHDRERKIEWKNRKTNRIEQYWNKKTNIYDIGNNLMENMIINTRNSYTEIRKRNNLMKEELKYINPTECEIINKLRTEYINCNNFKKFYFNETNGSCEKCKIKDSVEHLILDCKINDKMENNMNKIRNKFYKDLRKIHIHFKYPYNFEVMNILFPHIWLPLTNKKDKKYYYKRSYNLNIRIKIIKRVCKFIKDTKRFDEEKYGI